MTKKILSILIIVMLLFLMACENKSLEKPTEGRLSNKLKVYASIYPMYDFAKKIGKDKIEVKLMVPPGAEPHDWEPTAKLMAEIEEADVLIYNGVNMEIWMERLIGALNNKDLIIVEASRNIELKEFDEHEHEHDEEGYHEDHEEENHNHGNYDPHLWLDPIRAMKQAENIKNAFVQADKENKDFYEKNYKEFVKDLQKLDERFKEELKDKRTDYIVVAHGAFGYLGDRYGFKQISVAGLTPQEEPSAAKMARISNLVEEYEIKYIFFETLANPKLAKVIARETGTKTAVLNPIGGLTSEEMDKGKDYISVMEENLEALKKALR